MSIRVLIAGGGTSGHIHPALAIADRIREVDPESVIEFCGTARGIESDIVPKAGYTFHPIRARGIPSKPSPKMIKALIDMAAGRRTCISLIRSFRPDIVVGTGGYVCSPLISAAHATGTPVVLHEQNAFPGRSNRLMSRNAAVVCTSFPDIESYFPKAKRVIFTGNPVKKEFFRVTREEARRQLAIDENAFFILAMGGSLGARTINTSVLKMAEMQLPAGTKIILSAGKQQHGELVFDKEKLSDILEVREYIYDPHLYMAASDLVISRAGAITCAEVAALGLPSIMIPYPFAAGDHQTFNAMAFVKNDASVMIKDEDTTAESLADTVRSLSQDREKLVRMGRNAQSLSMPHAASAIVDEIFKVLKPGDNKP